MPDQLAFDVPDTTLADLDLEHADRELAAELSAAPPAPTCRCAPHDLVIEDEWGPGCLLCGRPT